jgi:hypothetical protein
MFIPTPQDAGGDFKPCPEGTHAAICIRVCDMGSRMKAYQGQDPKMVHEVLLSWELIDEKMSDGRPFIVSKNYTWSMSEKANLRKDLESWRGAKFTQADFGKFDIKNLLGKACLVGVTHTEVGERTYANVATVSKPMKGMTFPDPVNVPAYIWLNVDRFDETAFNALGDGLKGKIMQTPEYQEVKRRLDTIAAARQPASQPLRGTVSSGAPIPSHAASASTYDDDIPF